MSESVGNYPLLTDLYELTMAAGYLAHDKNATATFSLFLRRQPQRGYYVAAGLASALTMLEAFQFSKSDIDYLKQLKLFTPDFLTCLQSLKFTGDVWALPEGTLFFPDEPILEITAPLIEAQLVETRLLNIIGVHTLTATKGARCVYAAEGRRLIDFALRRTHGMEAGMAVARSTYLTGFEATSNVLAGKTYAIPVAGTMAHSFVQAFTSEQQAFEAYAATFPERTILLIDTYDILKGARLAIDIAQRLAAMGKRLIGVRLDSGDMVESSRQVRRLFDAAGLPDVDIMASGGFDEFAVAQALEKGAAIDAFGLGTKVGVSADRPYLDLVYKLVQYDNRNVRKLSPGKKTLAAQKQLFRFTAANGEFDKDVIGHRSEKMIQGQKLLQPVMHQGRIIRQPPPLEQIRQRFKSQFERLPVPYKHLHEPLHFPVTISRRLMAQQTGDVITSACLIPPT